MHRVLKVPRRVQASCTSLLAATFCFCAGTFAFPELGLAQSKPIINFHSPEREYRTIKRGKWSFEVEKQLLDEAPSIANRALKRLQENVDRAFRLLPKASHPVLLELKWFVMFGPKARGGGYDSGLEYCGPNAPTFRSYLDARWSRCIIVYCAENYLQISNLWALKAVLHELGHAHHYENWPEDQEDITLAWKAAVDRNLYVNVRDDKGTLIPKAYALTNQLEYFAELTATYFGRCNYAPFNRTGLQKYDPIGYAMLEKMWGLSSDHPAPPATKRAKPQAEQTGGEKVGKADARVSRPLAREVSWAAPLAAGCAKRSSAHLPSAEI